MKTKEEIEERIRFYQQSVEDWEEYDKKRVEQWKLPCYSAEIWYTKLCINELLWILEQ